MSIHMHIHTHIHNQTYSHTHTLTHRQTHIHLQVCFLAWVGKEALRRGCMLQTPFPPTLVPGCLLWSLPGLYNTVLAFGLYVRHSKCYLHRVLLNCLGNNLSLGGSVSLLQLDEGLHFKSFLEGKGFISGVERLPSRHKTPGLGLGKSWRASWGREALSNVRVSLLQRGPRVTESSSP